MVVGIVAVIVVTGIVALTLRGTESAPNGAVPPYSSASRAAGQVVSGVPGGPWDLVVAAGLGLTAPALAPVNSTLGSNCTYNSPLGGPPPSSVFVPRYGGGFDSGGSPWWGMIYFQSTSHQALLVEVLNGSARATLIASGGCTDTFQSYGSIPGNVVDSSAVATAVQTAGGSAFLSEHAQEKFNRVLGLAGGGTACILTSGPCWLVEYTPCNPLSSSNPAGSQPEFLALVNGLTGAVITHLARSSTCPQPGVTLADGGLGAPGGGGSLLGP